MAIMKNGLLVESVRQVGEGRRVCKALRLLGIKPDKIETRGVWRAGDRFIYEPAPIVDLGTRSGNGKFCSIRFEGEEVLATPFEPDVSTGACLWIEAKIPESK